MRKNVSLRLLSGVAFALCAAGCVPSDAEIDGNMAASRREAYLEWKSMRDRGQSAEAKVDGPLSLNDGVKVALQYNKLLQMGIQQREITRGERISAYQVVLPGLSLSAGTGHVEGTQGGYFDNYSAGFSVSQTILDASVPPVLRAARLNTALTDEGIRQQVQDLIASVANAYYDVLLAQRMVETNREALISAEAQYRMVSEKKKQETATEYDVLRAQVDVATFRASMQNEMNNVDTNRVSLLKLMGVSQDSEITFSDQLEFLPMRPVFERAVEIASGLRPDLRQAELNYRIEQEAVRIARSAFLPTVGATFAQNWAEAVSGNSFGRRPWSLSLGAGMELGVEDYGGLVSAKARAKRSQIGILDAQETAIKEIRQFMNSLANAEETVKALEVNQDAAREALRLVLVGYQAGVRTEVDVTDSRRALTDVMGQYYTALANHTKARLNLQIAMGVLGPARVTDGMPHPPNVPIANIAEFAATDYVPPAPIPMPTAETMSRPLNRSNQPSQPTSRAKTAPAETPRPAAAPAPTPEPVLSSRYMPPPPSESAVVAAPFQPQPLPAAASETVQAVLAAPAEVKTQPLFRITTREGVPNATEIARARQ